MTATNIQQMADRIARLMQDRLRVRGTGLAEKLRRGGRLLPRNVRAEAELLARAVGESQHPKLRMMQDQERIARAYDICLRHLRDLGATDRLIGRTLGIAGSVAFALIVVAALFLAVLVWRGFL